MKVGQGKCQGHILFKDIEAATETLAETTKAKILQ
jgi:hypothetical protein